MKNSDDNGFPVLPAGQELLLSTLIALYILLSFLAVFHLISMTAIASLAGSAYVVFAFPRAESSKKLNMFGAYGCGILLGGALSIALHRLPAEYAASGYFRAAFIAAAVFLTILTTSILNIQHAPAYPLTVSMVIRQDALFMGLATIGCIAFLVIYKAAMKKIFKNSIP